MSKKNHSCIYHFENYIQMQNLNFILKVWFYNVELNSRAEKIKTLHTIETKWGLRICSEARILALCLHTGKVKELVFKKYFKILLVSTS